MATEILRPNASGDECNLDYEDGAACPNHWENVDEEVSDELTTTVRTLAREVFLRDLYNIPASSVGSGTINKITVHADHFRNKSELAQGIKIAIKSGATHSYGSIHQGNDTWRQWFEEWATDPNTGSAWTWDAINILQIGIGLRAETTGWSYCSQVYVEVDYTPVGLENKSANMAAKMIESGLI